MQETVNWSPKLILFGGRSGKHSTIKSGQLWFFGGDLQENSGGCLKPIHAFAFCRASFLMTFSMGGIPHGGFRHDSPVATQEKATNPYVNSTGNVTLLFQLERKADLQVSTRDEA